MKTIDVSLDLTGTDDDESKVKDFYSRELRSRGYYPHFLAQHNTHTSNSQEEEELLSEIWQDWCDYGFDKRRKQKKKD